MEGNVSSRSLTALVVVLGISAAVVGIGMILSTFFAPPGVALVFYAYIRLDLVWRASTRDPAVRRRLNRNIGASVVAVVIASAFGIALWPGRFTGYLAGGFYVTLEIAVGVQVVRARRKLHSNISASTLAAQN